MITMCPRTDRTKKPIFAPFLTSEFSVETLAGAQ